nr:immunoglobulin light chain junction region [Macaca mulatta]
DYSCAAWDNSLSSGLF